MHDDRFDQAGIQWAVTIHRGLSIILLGVAGFIPVTVTHYLIGKISTCTPLIHGVAITLEMIAGLVIFWGYWLVSVPIGVIGRSKFFQINLIRVILLACIPATLLRYFAFDWFASPTSFY